MTTTAICDYCGEPREERYRLTCPRCGRTGCPACMPGGRGCICPECEEKDEEEEGDS